MVASRAHTARPWKVEYLGSWYLVSDRTVYCRAINEFDNQNFVAGGFVCDKGKFFFNDPDHPDGCYEFKEPNPVPPIEENDKRCELIPYESRTGDAKILCIGDTVREPCIWTNLSGITDEESRARIYFCIREHEKVHIAIREDMGSFCGMSSTQRTPEPNYYLGESLAYEDSMKCFQEQKEQCNTKVCFDNLSNAESKAGERVIENQDLYYNWDQNQGKN